jgi:hypothetical protein
VASAACNPSWRVHTEGGDSPGGPPMHRTHPQRQPGSPSGPFRADQLRDGDRYELS